MAAHLTFQKVISHFLHPKELGWEPSRARDPWGSHAKLTLHKALTLAGPWWRRTRPPRGDRPHSHQVGGASPPQCPGQHPRALLWAKPLLITAKPQGSVSGWEHSSLPPPEVLRAARGLQPPSSQGARPKGGLPLSSVFTPVQSGLRNWEPRHPGGLLFSVDRGSPVKGSPEACTVYPRHLPGRAQRPVLGPREILRAFPPDPSHCHARFK